jgi:NAD+ diphosphatase
MNMIVPSRPNPYTGSPLDRVGYHRNDEAWVAAALANPLTRYVPVWRAQSFLGTAPDGTPMAVFPAGLTVEGYGYALLGIGTDGQAIFALDVSAAEDPAPLMPPDGKFADLRSVGAGLPPEDAAVLAHARSMMHWRSRHKFCGVCGTACAPISAGNTMACPNCKTHHFPRTDPAVIMLVTSGDRALLGHSQRFPNSTMYSTLAGFVEPGESLEEAVRREVFEESGIKTGAVRYHSSQPWPFPGSIMLGFYAEGLSEAITVDKEELVDVQWFSREKLINHKDHGFSLPRADSIARRLIEDWIAA